MPSLLLRNIKTIFQIRDANPGKIYGAEMGELPELEDAYILIEDGIISAYGKMIDSPERADQTIEADRKFVLPAWCDSHTHIVYSCSREREMVDRIKGLSYEEIAKRGGGILNSAKRLRATSEEELLESAYSRLMEVQDFGTGAIEIKSGYGLDVESELKMLRVIRKLKGLSDMTIKASFLGAHAIPTEFRNDRSGYINLLINEMLPKVADEQLAEYCDVFCDQGFFTVEETDKILKAALTYGLKPKIHANELAVSGGVQVGIANNAISVDHLERVGDEEIEALVNSNTIPTLLPSCAFFLGIPYAPARKMIQAGLPVTLATDYNPGSTPSGKMNFVLSLACLKMKMLPTEAINAATINGACAMEVDSELGSITVGKKANLIITKEIPSLAYIPYSFGSDLVDSVIINGKKIA